MGRLLGRYNRLTDDIEFFMAFRLRDAIESIAAAGHAREVLTALQPHRELSFALSPVSVVMCNRVTLKLVGRVTDEHCFPLVLLEQWARDPEVPTEAVLDLLGEVLAEIPERDRRWL